MPEWLGLSLSVFNGLAVLAFGGLWILGLRDRKRLERENVELRLAKMRSGCEQSRLKDGLRRQFGPPPPQAEVDLDEAWMDSVSQKMLAADPKTILTGTVKVNVQDGTYEINYDQDGTSERGRIGDLVGPSDSDRDHG